MIGWWWLLACGGLPELPEVAEPCGTWPEPGLYSYVVQMPDKDREVIVEIGATEGPRDLVVAVHGGRQDAMDFRAGTRFGNLAATEPLVAAFPQGRKAYLWRAWNAGSCCGNLDDEHRDVDDVGFLEKLVEELAPRVCADRVLAAGFSNGGMMVNRWACEGENLDVVVTAAGPLLVDSCEGEPRAFRAYHGTADDRVPLAGGSGPFGSNTWPPAYEGWETWKERNLCKGELETFVFGPQTCVRYDCAAPTEVCTIDAWPHMWPGGRNGVEVLESDATRDSVSLLRRTFPREGEIVTEEPGTTP